jgi:hypothetical protein
MITDGHPKQFGMQKKTSMKCSGPVLYTARTTKHAAVHRTIESCEPKRKISGPSALLRSTSIPDSPSSTPRWSTTISLPSTIVSAKTNGRMVQGLAKALTGNSCFRKTVVLSTGRGCQPSLGLGKALSKEERVRWYFGRI